MAKAAIITKENKVALSREFDLEEDELDDKVGLYLLTDFGQSKMIHGFIEGQELMHNYRVTDAILQNGWVEVKRKTWE